MSQRTSCNGTIYPEKKNRRTCHQSGLVRNPMNGFGSEQVPGIHAPRESPVPIKGTVTRSLTQFPRVNRRSTSRQQGGSQRGNWKCAGGAWKTQRVVYPQIKPEVRLPPIRPAVSLSKRPQGLPRHTSTRGVRTARMTREMNQKRDPQAQNSTRDDRCLCAKHSTHSCAQWKAQAIPLNAAGRIGNLQLPVLLCLA